MPWPAKDEFEVGSTYQHAGYVITWLCAMFGPARGVTSFASVQIPDKGIAVDVMAPDFTVGCIEFDGGVVARVTCGLAAPRDKSITVVGDKGTLMVGNVRDDRAPVMWRSVVPGRLERLLRHRVQISLPLAPGAAHGCGCRGTLRHTVAGGGAVDHGGGLARQAR